jgi:hypothetical protein
VFSHDLQPTHGSGETSRRRNPKPDAANPHASNNTAKAVTPPVSDPVLASRWAVAAVDDAVDVVIGADDAGAVVVVGAAVTVMVPCINV